MTSKKLSERLKDFRMDRQWTLQQVANVTGLDVRTIWNLEKDRVRPHDRTVAKIRKAIPVIFEEDAA